MRPKLVGRLSEHREQAELSRELARIRCDAPMETSEESVKRNSPLLDELNALYDEAGFGRSLRNQAETHRGPLPKRIVIDRELLAEIEPITGKGISANACSGGSINQSFRLSSPDGREWFLKLNDRHKIDMFSAEALGLNELASAAAIRVPEPLVHGVAGRHAYLLIEYLDLDGRLASAASLLGRQLAQQHRSTAAKFGWDP